MTFSVFTPLLTTTLNLNLSTISVRLECAAFSFPGIAWILNFIVPSSLPTSFASCNSVGIQPEFLSSAQLRDCYCYCECEVESAARRIGGAGCGAEQAGSTFQICCLCLLQAYPLCFQVLVSSHQEVQFRYERHHCNRLVVLYIMSKIVFFFWSTFFDFCPLRFQVLVSSHQEVQFRY